MATVFKALKFGFLMLCASCGDSTFEGQTAQREDAPPKNMSSSNADPGTTSPTGQTTPGKVQAPTPLAVSQLQKTCQAAQDRLVVKSQAVNYPERKDCKFRTSPSDTTNPNLERRDTFNQASETSSSPIQLPDGVICDIAIASPASAQLHYDDFLILTLHQQTLFASNKGLIEYLENSLNTFAWDWKRVVGKPIQNFGSSAYCVGATGECVLPGHDQVGPVRINLKSSSIAPIAVRLSGLSQTTLDLIATGDNDNEDCYHSALDLTVEIAYIPK